MNSNNGVNSNYGVDQSGKRTLHVFPSKKSHSLSAKDSLNEVDSNDGVNSNNGAILKSAVNSNNRGERSDGSCLYIFSRVEVALLPR